MTNALAIPRLQDVRRNSQLIRARWTNAQRRQRRRLAAIRQRKLLEWLAVVEQNPAAAPYR